MAGERETGDSEVGQTYQMVNSHGGSLVWFGVDMRVLGGLVFVAALFGRLLMWTGEMSLSDDGEISERGKRAKTKRRRGNIVASGKKAQWLVWLREDIKFVGIPTLKFVGVLCGFVAWAVIVLWGISSMNTFFALAAIGIFTLGVIGFVAALIFWPGRTISLAIGFSIALLTIVALIKWFRET